MSMLDPVQLSQKVLSSLGRVRARTWLILGGAALAVLGLMVWAGIALLSWLWAQAPQLAVTGRQWAGEAMTQVEEVAPGLKNEVVKWLPGAGEVTPERDVSGSDPGPVDRFPGLVRSRFVRDESLIEATYVGRADFDAVLTHYVQGFAGGGFTQEVLAAAAEEERHQFVGASGRFEVRIGRRPGGVVEVGVRQVLQ
ncbi:hypothetical protein [Thioalkalivibrio sulfidiphilus]|uniref:hypothetical protein n=1 Tax=Thioalkalivibrio sulfidiphilus TaxID=1033854 RepID=UPI003B29C2B7